MDPLNEPIYNAGRSVAARAVAVGENPASASESRLLATFEHYWTQRGSHDYNPISKDIVELHFCAGFRQYQEPNG